VLVGTGAQVLQNLKIGENAIIGAGAVVSKNVEPMTTVVGIPAKPLIRSAEK
jgi:serine acetyltransferase